MGTERDVLRSIPMLPPSRLSSSRRMLLLSLVGVVGVEGCLAPTLPLPPPDRPEVEGPDAQGSVRLTGTAPDTSAVVFALNNRTNQVVGQRTAPLEKYALTMLAQNGDGITFWYSVGTEQSPSIYFEIGSRVR